MAEIPILCAQRLTAIEGNSQRFGKPLRAIVPQSILQRTLSRKQIVEKPQVNSNFINSQTLAS